ncbi:MAG TPA: preprotein translocase subunit SecG [Bacteroidia bacterium]|nr:preprotein translocase subunit SecG [Bacteroidia bacterium]
MSAVISVLILLCCIFLVLAVLVQNPKGGGLASGFTSGAQVMGVRGTADFLEKATWTIAIVLFVISVFSTGMAAKAKNQGGEASVTKDKAAEFNTKPNAGGSGNAFPINNANPPAANAPAPVPAGGQK